MRTCPSARDLPALSHVITGYVFQMWLRTETKSLKYVPKYVPLKRAQNACSNDLEKGAAYTRAQCTRTTNLRLKEAEVRLLTCQQLTEIGAGGGGGFIFSSCIIFWDI